MARIRSTGLFIAGIVLCVSPVFAETVYYVQSAKAKVMSAPSFKAPMLGEASRGTRLNGTAREGRWIKVSYYGKTGYVATLLVTSYPPMAMKGLIKAEDTDFQQSVRRRASTYTSAAAARGLAQDDRRRISGEDRTDYDGLARVEAVTVSEVDVLTFMEEGKL